MRKRRGQFSLRRRHFARCFSRKWKFRKQEHLEQRGSRQYRLACGFLSRYTSMPTVLMRVFSEVRIHRRCSRLFSSTQTVVGLPGPGTQSVRYRRTYRSGYAIFPSSHSFAAWQLFTWNVNEVHSLSTVRNGRYSRILHGQDNNGPFTQSSKTTSKA